jgi:hypothetical protein
MEQPTAVPANTTAASLQLEALQLVVAPMEQPTAVPANTTAASLQLGALQLEAAPLQLE